MTNADVVQGVGKSSLDRRDGCKGCGPEFTATDEDIERMLQAPMFQSPEHCVADEVYAYRLAQCGSCPKLQDGRTCLACGCYVRVAAKLKAKRCPLPGANRWGD